MARTGMTNLLTELRGLTEAGTADYTVGTATYWADDTLQDILDIHRTDVIREQLQTYPNYVSAGSISYTDYRSTFAYFEATTGGTVIFYVQDAAGSTIGTANYTPDYRRGQLIFGADQGGTAYYLTGRSYDLNAAAADVWRRKAAHYAPSSFDFSTDNHSIKRSQVYDHCLAMATYFESMSKHSIQVVEMFRSDLS